MGTSTNFPPVDIFENLTAVMNRISAAADRVDRDPSDIRLVAVSKSQSVEKIKDAYAAGIRDFGENRVHEGTEKIAELSELKEIRWHMIGHIQSRKTRQIVPDFSIVHSVDRMKIARRLNTHSEEHGIRLPVFLECNVSGEATKEGWNLETPESWSGIIEEFTAIQNFPHLEVRGLMTMAPFGASEVVLRTIFKRLKALQGFLIDHVQGNWNELSMGMTDDFEIAIEEGATLVRIGRAIFGPRGDT